MAFVVKADPKNRGKLLRIEVPDADLAQDTPEQHAARLESRPVDLASRVAALESELAALKARVKQ